MSVRDKIVEAALKLLARKSFSRVSVREIADEANVAKGTVFHYFKSKFDIGLAVLDMFYRVFVETPLRKIIDSDMSFEEKIGAIVDHVLDVMLKSNVKYMVMLVSIYEEIVEKGREDIVKHLYLKGISLFEEFFRENNIHNPAVKAQLFAALLDGLALHCMIYPELFRSRERRASIVNEVLSLLKGE